jgi:hypothetical protein
MFAVIDEIHACARPVVKVPVPAAALLGGEQRRPWNVARNDCSAGRPFRCAALCLPNLSGVHRRFMLIAGVPSLGSPQCFLAG